MEYNHRTLEQQLKHLQDQFRELYVTLQRFSKLHIIKQGARTIEEYSQEFEHLLMKYDINEDDLQTFVRYLGGLEPTIANIVELQPYSSLPEMRLLAHKIESQQKNQSKV
ncbi:hypothetical protein E3N88_12805 [Mikania micrantha]|uniref:Retrotransposon gag domain-containing protein n=1 Tax=Mikania micrantha TaxID=192012 RepID=A0A5N6P9I1_9ASTR|nr:hypothetical protein E3N88_12805 [Mikania micrantha]